MQQRRVRSEYSPVFFGELYESLQDLKAAFDPHNQLNPGKIATPSRSGATLLKINEVPMRGQLDRTIDERVWKSFGTAMHCNGNGACYNFDPDDAMCPSWKGTRDRVHSPKGRASLMREWLRLQGSAGINVLDVRRNTYSFFTGLPQRWRNSRAMHLNKSNAQSDFSHQVYDAMAGCLACKSCSGQCPVKVSVPEFRARFLELYHQRYLRPLKDYLIGSLEFTIPYFARMPAIYNAITDAGPVRNWLENHAGMVDSPLLSRFDFAKSVRRWNVLRATPERLAKLSNEEKLRSVIFVQDAFTRYFETPLAAAFIELAARLKFTVYLVPFRPNGKPLQVQGFLAAFDHTARKNAMQLSALAGFGVPLVGLDPAMTLVYRQEYRKVESAKDCPEVLLPQEWLIQSLPKSPLVVPPRIYRLMAHCTEKTNVPSSTTLWQNVFTRAGLHLMVEHSGCCGMSGTYGHETRNVKTSEVIFEQSWGPLVDGSKEKPELLATGYSCRSQVERFRRVRLRHPLEVILSALAISPSRLL